MFVAPLLAVSLADDPDPVVALARALADDATRLQILVCAPEPGRLSLAEPDLAAAEAALERGDAVLQALTARLAGSGLAVDGEVVLSGPTRNLFAAIDARTCDLVVLGPFGDAARETVAGLALDLARARGLTTAVGALLPDRPPQLRRYLHPFDGRADSLAAIGAFLRDRCDARHAVVLLALGALDPRLAVDRAALREVAGIRADVALESLAGGWLSAARAPDALAERHHADALLLSADVGAGLPDVAVRLALRALSRVARPIVFAPAPAAVPRPRDGQLDACDVLCPPEPSSSSPDPLDLRLERLGTFGSAAPLADGPIDVVAGGRRVATAQAQGGRLRLLRSELGEASIGLGRPVDGADPLAAIDVVVRVAQAGTRRLALVDARIDGDALAAVRAALDDDDARAVFCVRLTPDVAARELRARWLAAGFRRPHVLDVRDLLDEGDATDVHVEVAPVRLCRAAARLRLRGARVDLVLARAPGRARADGFAVLTPDDLADLPARLAAAYRPPPPAAADRLSARLDLMTASRREPGHRVHVELDNAAARRELLARIDSATRRVHAQWYIVEDDEVTREVEAALVAAAARGVEVRVLVDSLYSLHGSFGVENALLRRLAAAPGVELRASRPIQHVPSLADLKQRDHRKLLVVDGARAIVSGRNLGKQYYRSFAEARVTRRSPYSEVPWFDASAAIDGPAVATLDATFAQAWLAAGGAPFAIDAPPPAGDAALRVVVHHGLADAYTLEAYLALIETAESRLLVVNSFPLQLEVQHALLRALARGVALSVLVGRARPAWGDDVAFPGSGSIRALADALVRARLATLIEAGADVRELAIAPPTGWDAQLGLVRPHVHAKLVCADGRVVALGSANLDVTAGYWESEALVLVDDGRVAASVEAAIDELRLASPAIDPADAKWREGAALRAWLGRVWPSVIG